MSRRKKESSDLRRRAKRHEEKLAATTGLATGLRLAERLLEDGRLPEAYQRLHELDREYPQRREVLGLLAEICRQLNVAEYRQVCQRLVDLDPADCEAVLSLANAHLQNDQMTLMLVAYRRFLERWPRDSRVARLQEPVRMLEKELEEKRLNAKLAREDSLLIFTYHEQIQIALSDQEFEHAVELADRILARYPHFDAAGNNRAEALFQLGRLDDAITECRRVLGYKPENFFTLAILTRYLFFRGDTLELADCVARLKSFDTRWLAWWCKTMETLSMLGDDAGVLEVFGRAEGELQDVRPPSLDAGFLYHYAAAAQLRLGDETQARRLWRKAVESWPGLDPAVENLADLQRPVGEWNAPWSVRFHQWLPALVYQELSVLFNSEKRQTSEYLAQQQRLLQMCPYLPRLVPVLLERGDPVARVTAYWIASTSETPEMLAALRTFALGKYGPDKLRHNALMTLLQKHAVGRHVTMWREGQWREENVFAWEIYGGDIVRGWPDEVERLAARAEQAQRLGQAKLAEVLFREALSLRPDTPELLNNLGAALGQQGRYDEATALAERICRDHPDYLFGRTNLALILANRGELERAQQLLEPLLDRERFSGNEFSAICFCKANLARHQGQSDQVQFWADYLARVQPNDPKLAIIRKWC